MNRAEALRRMVAPGTRRPGKYREGVVQVHLTRACDKACFGCTQGSQLAGRAAFISPTNFERACDSLEGYFGVVGVFGGNPATHPEFPLLCEILRSKFPKGQRGIWCNHPRGHGKVMRETFDPAVSNLNVHLDRAAYDEFRRDWPESRPFGLREDSRHSPPWVAMKDLVADEGRRWELISRCDINRHWSAMLAQFRGSLRAYFCEIAGAQSVLHQDDPTYPDTGLDPAPGWWRLPMEAFAAQVDKHCHECGVPLRGRGELACAGDGTEHVSAAHAEVFKPKRPGRRVELVTLESQLGGRVRKFTDYLGNAR